MDALQSFDLILAGGDVIDGDGGPKVRADVGLRDGRIAVKDVYKKPNL